MRAKRVAGAPADLHAGRSRASMLLVAFRHVHVFVWPPWWGIGSWGATVRYRRAGGWTHWRLVLWQRNRLHASSWRGTAGRLRVRRTVTAVEVTRWRTAPGTRERVGLKQYLRIKVSAGGREVRDDEHRAAAPAGARAAA